MSETRNVVIEVKFEHGGSLQVYFQAVTTNEAIERMLEEISFRNKPISMGTIKEKKKKVRSRAGFTMQESL